VIHASEEDPVAAIRALTGVGVDFAFEAAGRQETIRQAWASLAIGGEAILVGLLRHGEQITLESGPFVSEKAVRGCYLGSAHLAEDVPALVDRYLAGELLLDPIISRHIALADLDDAFARLRSGQEARQVLIFDLPLGDAVLAVPQIK
jgi:S-(hydroxymethyl)glutathione dehydrogenase/alcohol dehydrogenase